MRASSLTPPLPPLPPLLPPPLIPGGLSLRRPPGEEDVHARREAA